MPSSFVAPGAEPSLCPGVHAAHAPRPSVPVRPSGRAGHAGALTVLHNGPEGSRRPLPKVKGGVWGNKRGSGVHWVFGTDPRPASEEGQLF